MKVIFLDVDGVLNCIESKSRQGCYIGIDDIRVKRLKEIVDKTGARIVLTSTWKLGWEVTDKECMKEGGKYLDRKMKRQNLTILDKTYDQGWNRGFGITHYLNTHDVGTWVVLDDEIFKDYEAEGILPHLVKTNFYDENGGIQEEHVKKAIELLNKED
jgi:hypothetical protein